MPQASLEPFQYKKLNNTMSLLMGVDKIPNYLIDENDWTATIPPAQEAANNINLHARTIQSRCRTKESLLKIRPTDGVSPNIFSCSYCNRTWSSPACTIACYTAFREAHFDQKEAMIEIKDTRETGKGVFLLPGNFIHAGNWIGEYLGRILPAGSARANNSDYVYKLDAQTGTAMRQIDVDASTEGNWTRFLNHCCRPNCATIEIYVGKVRLTAFYALRRIRAGEELTINYGEAYFNTVPKMLCRCNAKDAGSAKRTRKRAHNAVSEDEECSENDREYKKRATLTYKGHARNVPAKVYNLRPRTTVIDYNPTRHVPLPEPDK